MIVRLHKQWLQVNMWFLCDKFIYTASNDCHVIVLGLFFSDPRSPDLSSFFVFLRVLCVCFNHFDHVVLYLLLVDVVLQCFMILLLFFQLSLALLFIISKFFPKLILFLPDLVQVQWHITLTAQNLFIFLFATFFIFWLGQIIFGVWLWRASVLNLLRIQFLLGCLL